MMFGFFGRVSAAPRLVEALDASAQRRDVIAQRISAATARNQSGFAVAMAAAGAGDAIDLEAEMTQLANEDVNNQALTKMLQSTYASLRSVIRDR
jgi:hypothetical protein